jgi:hypothetical protein
VRSSRLAIVRSRRDDVAHGADVFPDHGDIDLELDDGRLDRAVAPRQIVDLLPAIGRLSIRSSDHS